MDWFRLQYVLSSSQVPEMLGLCCVANATVVESEYLSVNNDISIGKERERERRSAYCQIRRRSDGSVF